MSIATMSPGVRVRRRMALSMLFKIARAKYFLGYGRRAGLYVRAALHRARYPSPSRSGIRADRCHVGRFWTKHRATTVTISAWSVTSCCCRLESFDRLLMLL
jgi:hypothetical protein